MSSASNSHNHTEHYTDMWTFPSAEQMTWDVAGKTYAMPSFFKLALLISGALAVLGIIGFILRAATSGFGNHAPWGYYMAIFSFIFLVSSSAPLAVIAFRITKNHWYRPMARVSGLFAVLGVLNVLMFIPLMMALPPIQNPAAGEAIAGELEIRRTIWIQVPIGAPHWWDMLGIISLAVASLAILWLSSVPDMAEARLSSTGWRRKVYTLLAGHWYGTKRQWVLQKGNLAIMGAFYFMMLIFVHFLIVSDYGMSMIPGWKDSILPPLYTVLGLQTALGLILIILFILRRWGGYRQYIGISPSWSASKVLLGLTLLWVYHLFAFFITYWYGRLEVEQNIIYYLLLGTYAGIFWPNVIFTFFAPFFLLIWNPVRRSDWGPALAGVLIVIGCLLFNIRTFVAAFNAGNVYSLSLAEIPPPAFPDIWDIFIVIGGLGLAAFIYLLATKVIPVLSIWEIKEATKYQSRQLFMRTRSLVLAKPE
jgi:hypothetical protein